MNSVQFLTENVSTQALDEQKSKEGALQGRKTATTGSPSPEFVLLAINSSNDKGDEVESKELEKNLKQKKVRDISLGASGISCLTGLVFFGAASLSDNTPCWIVAAILEAVALGNYLGTYYCYPCTKLPDEVIDHISLE